MTSDLCIKIAESLGWQVHPRDRWIVIPPNSPHSVQPLSTLPAYDTDANAALQLVEVLKKDGWSVHLDNANAYKKQGEDWYCAFVKFPHTPPGCHAPTLPEAICLAYAKVKGIEVLIQ